MNRPLALLAGSLLLVASPAFAQSAACTRPAVPAAVDGATATIEQMQAFRGQVSAFIADSDTYQACLVADVKAQRDAAKASKSKFDEKISKDIEKSIDANQKDKVAVGKAFGAARKAYTTAHPA